MMKMKHWVWGACSLALALLTACGGGSGTPEAASTAVIGMALDNPANPTKLYLANTDKNVVQMLTLSSNQVTTFAGTVGTAGTGNGSATSATFYAPFGVAVNGSDLYVADTANQGIRKISSGIVSTVAGTLGTAGAASGSTGATSSFNTPKSLVSDGSGNLYVVDSSNHAIRKVVLSTGATSVLAGYPGSYGSSDGTGSAANFLVPFGVALVGSDLYVTDTGNHTIRKVTSSGVVTTLTGVAGTSGTTDTSGGTPKFNYPAGIVSDGTNLYVADSSNHTIRKIVISSGAVSTLAGSAGVPGSTDGTGSAARFDSPVGLALDTLNGQLYVSDQNYQKIRKVNTATGAVSTLSATF